PGGRVEVCEQPPALGAPRRADPGPAQRRGVPRGARLERRRARPPPRRRDHRRDAQGGLMPTHPDEWGYAHDFEDVNGQVAMWRVGDSDHAKASGRTTHEIVGQAVERALADAGLEPSDVDGLM